VPADRFDYQGLRRSATKYEDSFVVVGGFSPIFYLIADLCGMQKALMDMIQHPELIYALVEKIVEFYENYFSRICKAGRGKIDAIAFGDDFANVALGKLSNGSRRFQVLRPVPCAFPFVLSIQNLQSAFPVPTSS
jgi:hypothetical protein